MASQQVSVKKQQELQAQYSTYKDTLQQVARKIGDVEQEAEEHKLVLETLEPLPGDRKCFRLINGVLVERTVKDVVPALKTNAEGLRKVLEDLVKQYKGKEEEFEKWKVRFQRWHGPNTFSLRTRTYLPIVYRKRTMFRSCSLSLTPSDYRLDDTCIRFKALEVTGLLMCLLNAGISRVTGIAVDAATLRQPGFI
ncbi:hypothetical protein MCOR25_001616 [Pyricularia grisea]|nr:hypothetical protein MCOR25_001616 [Pyricularia grisea]